VSAVDSRTRAEVAVKIIRAVPKVSAVDPPFMLPAFRLTHSGSIVMLVALSYEYCRLSKPPTSPTEIDAFNSENASTGVVIFV
jgi:hypothetical protein